MTVTEMIASWVEDAERMNHSPAQGVVVTDELFGHLVREQSSPAPVVAGLSVLRMATEAPTAADLPTLSEMVEIPGPDRVSIYVGHPPGTGRYPAGLDPAMPVVFVPVPPATLEHRSTLEMYNRLRWYGLGPDEALAGS